MTEFGSVADLTAASAIDDRTDTVFLQSGQQVLILQVGLRAVEDGLQEGDEAQAGNARDQLVDLLHPVGAVLGMQQQIHQFGVSPLMIT